MSSLDHEPSAFWHRLGGEQARALETHGVEVCKRTLAVRYFQWQWRWRTLPRSEQARFLVRHSSPLAISRAFLEPMKLDDDAWSGTEWSRADRRLYVAAVRLIWDYAIRHGDPAVTKLAEPRLGSPLPVYNGGRLISQDLANSALETAAAVRALDGTEPRRILEVGAGYGRTAYALLNRFPEAEYTVVDIDPARSVARWYLTQLFPERRLTFLDPGDARRLGDGEFDFVTSISSLQEMTGDQVTSYLRLFDRVAKGGVVYLKQWARWWNPVDEIHFDSSALQIPQGWLPLLHERCPIQTRFVQNAWHVTP
jgi:putative sugar O-methyltransferase